MKYTHEYIGYEKIDGIKFYLSENKSLVKDKNKAIKSPSITYFIERNLEPEVIKVPV